MLRLAIPLSLILIMNCLPVPAQAQVRRCTASDGGLIYTDRKCDDIGASERLVSRATPGLYGSHVYRGCARSVQDLVYSLSSAIESTDVNQLAGVYDFSGASTSSGYKLMDRLALIAKRPLVDVQPMYSGGNDPYANAYADIAEFDENGEVIPHYAPKPRLIGLRIEQTLANGSTPSRTVFGLRKNMGCWWVHF
ncbi:MAG: hypothetical protein ABIO61_00285 [Thermomonas sp.]